MAFSSAECVNMGVGARVAKGTGPTAGGATDIGLAGGASRVESERVSGDEGGKGWGFHW